MELLIKIPFSVEGVTYEVRILGDENKINFVTFLNNHPANGFRYQIMVPKNIVPKKLLSNQILKDLEEKCKKDITDNRWQNLSRDFL
jgi:hypothetical protein